MRQFDADDLASGTQPLLEHAYIGVIHGTDHGVMDQ
jgi:hypothetical protein